MTQKELIEIIQQHHPKTGETLIRQALNRAKDDFAAKTSIVEVATDGTDVTVAGQRYYSLPPELLELKRVELGNISIKRLIFKPIEGDIT